MRFSAIFLPVFLLSAFGCDEVKLRPKPDKPPSDRSKNAFSGDYIQDGKGGLFQNVRWYHYDMTNHLIWPLFDVFQIQTPRSTYKLQIRRYYGETEDQTGHFQIRIQSSDGQDQTLQVLAPGCGNPFTNPDFEECLKDPTRNVFIYLNLGNFEQRTLTDAAALSDREWDVAFKGTDVKLNSGLSGPSTVRGALLKRFDFFFEAGEPSLPALINRENWETAKSEFDAVEFDSRANYFLPDGIDRVVHESYWLKLEKNGQRRIDPDKWWLLQGVDSASYVKFHFLKLESESELNRLTVEYFYQSPSDDKFQSQHHQLSIEIPRLSQNIEKFCFDFANNLIGCESPTWFLQFLAKGDEWRMRTRNGGIGPLTPQEAEKIDSGAGVAPR